MIKINQRNHLNKIMVFLKSSLGDQWYFFITIFFISLIIKIFVIKYASNAQLGWDENQYFHHAKAMHIFLSNFNIEQWYHNYYVIRPDFIRFFPFASPFGYAIFGYLTDDLITGARLYNAILVSIGIASSSSILLLLTRNKAFSFIVALIANIAPVTNAYVIFLWTEGAQFGLLSFILLLNLGKKSIKIDIVTGLLLAILLATHGSFLLINCVLIVYLIVREFEKTSIVNILQRSAILITPSILVILGIGVISQPIIKEFVLITSESIPMKSLNNPPSSYINTWEKINQVSIKNNITLSAASSKISYEFLQEKGALFIFNRGWDQLHIALQADVFLQRHFNAHKWECIPTKTFQIIQQIHNMTYYMIYVGILLFFYLHIKSDLAKLIIMIFFLKVILIFYTGVGSTRYFSTFFMFIIPFSFYGFYSFFLAFKKLDKIRLRLLSYFLLAMFTATFVL